MTEEVGIAVVALGVVELLNRTDKAQSQRKDQESAFPKLLRVLVSYKGRVGYAPTIGWRIDTEDESGGIDVAQHRESAYDLSSDADSSRGRMGATINGQGNTSTLGTEKSGHSSGSSGVQPLWWIQGSSRCRASR